MKKFSVFLVLTLLIVSFSSTLIFAEEEYFGREDEFVKVKSIEFEEIQHVKPMEQKEVEKIFSKMEKEFRIKGISQKEYEKALKDLKTAREIQSFSESSDISTLGGDYYDQYLNELRQGNFVETILDIDEGMSETQIYKVGYTHANAARDAALAEYPNDVMLRDAYRHFVWNHMSTSDSSVGKIKTRTATINHEWGIILLSPLENHYNNAYNDYINSGYSEEDAALNAFNDTVAYILTLKYNTVLICESNYDFFKAIFEVSNIMDLHNNCYGRAYPENHPTLNYDQAFHYAKNNGELILNENSVDDNDYYHIWAWDWYTY